MLGDVFGLDLRSLALFRVSLALVLLYDLFVRWSNLEAHYTDAGVLPRALLPGYPQVLSYHAIVGSVPGESFLFITAALFATCLLIGYKTWTATALSWVMLLSVQARNPFVLQGGDVVMRLLLFWSLFLPLGAVWSLDARFAATGAAVRRRNVTSLLPIIRYRLLTVGGAAYVLQLCCIYCFSVYFKSGAAWHREGTAVYDALSLDQFATAAGKALLNLRWTGLLAFLTHAVVYFETFAPILMLLPWRLGPLRTLLVFAFIGFHAGLGTCLRLGTFPVICSVAWLALLPSWFWERLARTTVGPGRLRNAICRARAEDNATGVAASALPALLPAPPSARLSRGRRPWRGDSLFCQSVAAFFLVYILLWNLRTTGNPVATALLSHASGIGWTTRLDQEWNLFGPRPYVRDGWHVAAARLADGSAVDLLRGTPLTWDKPGLVSAIYKNEQWRKYLDHMREPGYAAYRPSCASYLVRLWNRRHPANQRVESVALYFIEEDVLPDYQARTLQPRLLWQGGQSAAAPPPAPPPGLSAR